MSNKVENYSAEMVATLVNGYKDGASVEQLAAAVGKSVRSVVAKLSREGVYVAKAKAKAVAGVTKASLIAELAAQRNVEPEVLASLEKATKEALQILVG